MQWGVHQIQVYLQEILASLVKLEGVPVTELVEEMGDIIVLEDYLMGKNRFPCLLAVEEAVEKSKFSFFFFVVFVATNALVFAFARFIVVGVEICSIDYR